jgi:hypothetical protein
MNTSMYQAGLCSRTCHVIASLAVQTHSVIIFSRSRRPRVQLEAVGYCASLALMPMRCLIYWSPKSAWFILLEESLHITMDMIASQVRRHSLTVRRFFTPERFAGVTLTISLKEAAIVTTASSATEYGHREAKCTAFQSVYCRVARALLPPRNASQLGLNSHICLKLAPLCSLQGLISHARTLTTPSNAQ